jgi:hypothetical protein
MDVYAVSLCTLWRSGVMSQYDSSKLNMFFALSKQKSVPAAGHAGADVVQQFLMSVLEEESR